MNDHTPTVANGRHPTPQRGAVVSRRRSYQRHANAEDAVRADWDRVSADWAPVLEAHDIPLSKEQRDALTISAEAERSWAVAIADASQRKGERQRSRRREADKRFGLTMMAVAALMLVAVVVLVWAWQ